MPASVFKVTCSNGRWSVSSPLTLKDRCEIPLTNSKYQAIEAARDLAIAFAPAIVEVLEVNGSLGERIYVDAKKLQSD